MCEKSGCEEKERWDREGGSRKRESLSENGESASKGIESEVRAKKERERERQRERATDQV